MRVNFVISKNMGSKIFSDIFARFRNSGLFDIVVSESPVENSDIYHYHRPHLVDKLKKNSVVTVHHDPHDNDPSLQLERFLPRYSEAAAVICLSSRQHKILAQAGIRKISIIPHGFDKKLFYRKRRRVWQGDRKLMLGLVSRRYGRRVKGEQILTAFADRADPARVAFTLIGEGRSTDAAYLEKLGFEVSCIEYLPYRLFPSMYESLDCLLNLSSFEGGPASLPEAIASGTPIASTQVGMAPDLIEHGVNGWLLPNSSFESCIHSLLEFTSNSGNCFDAVADGAYCRNYTFSWDEVIESHAKLYRSILNKAK